MGPYRAFSRGRGQVALAAFALVVGFTGVSLGQQLLDPSTQPRFVNPLPIIETYTPGANSSFPGADYYEVEVTQFRQWLGLCKPTGSTTPCDPTAEDQRLYTTVWGFGQVGHPGIYPGKTFETRRNTPVVVKWINNLKTADERLITTHLLAGAAPAPDAVDTTIHGAALGESHVRLVVHNHGAEVRSDSDGYPDCWFTNDRTAPANGFCGPAGNSALYTYPNQQPPMTLWYHDHSLGMTRLNIYAGLAGFFLVRDPKTEAPLNLPSGKYEIPLLIQDRSFNTDGSLFYINADVVGALGNSYHPNWRPEFFGNLTFQDFILVNGKVWPFLNVEPRKYRFRILNASNARMYNLRLINQVTGNPWEKVYQIGSDGGYLAAPAKLAQTTSGPADDITDQSTKLFLAPAERVDVVIDFSAAPVGTTFLFRNDANAPFPSGITPNFASSGSVMQFRVVAPREEDESSLPAKLNYLNTRLDQAAVTKVRHLALTEVEDPNTGNPTVGLINNTCWDTGLGTEVPNVTEKPVLGTTEIWEITNTTPDTHPIHLHLVEFNLLDRQVFDLNGYLAALSAANGGATVVNGVTGTVSAPSPNCPQMISPVGFTTTAQTIPDVTPFLQGNPIPPNATEAGFKDTIRVKHGTVTRFLVKFAPQDPADGTSTGAFRAFDATKGPGYVWHCHILEHEDNEMMRPYRVREKEDD